MDLNICEYEELKSEIQLIRKTVFENEQGVDRRLERDGKDPECVHVVAFNPCGVAVGTGRLENTGKIGRLAVLKPYRKHAVGSRILKALTEQACKQKMDQVYLHAQRSAVAFYIKQGFVTDGREFWEAGIPHTKMIRRFGAP